MQNRDLRHEEARLQTYIDVWPPAHVLRPADLAQAGLYAVGRGDMARCVFCRVQLHNWTPDDSPMREHFEKTNGKCPFVNGKVPENVPMKPKVTVKHSKYARETARLETFATWPIGSHAKPVDLAKAGFFYMGSGDKVCCFSCDGRLESWNEGDMPKEEHRKWNPNCSFVTANFFHSERPDEKPMDIGFPVQESMPSPNRRRKISRIASVEHYTMTHEPRGICLIINNQHFLPKWRAPNGLQFPIEREGSDVDAENLRRTFSDFGFDVHMKVNVTHRDIIQGILKDYTTDGGFHANADAFVCCLLSHGGYDKIFGVDGVPVNVSEILKSFTDENCPDLQQKPKLFFIQSCRIKEICDHPNRQCPDPLAPTQWNDFLLLSCSPPHHCNCRSPDAGTVFVNELTRTFQRLASKEDVMSMTTEVRRAVVSRMLQMHKDGKCPDSDPQMPPVTSTLVHKVFMKRPSI